MSRLTGPEDEPWYLPPAAAPPARGQRLRETLEAMLLVSAHGLGLALLLLLVLWRVPEGLRIWWPLGLRLPLLCAGVVEAGLVYRNNGAWLAPVFTLALALDAMGYLRLRRGGAGIGARGAWLLVPAAALALLGVLVIACTACGDLGLVAGG